MATSKKKKPHVFFAGRLAWQIQWRKCIEAFLQLKEDRSPASRRFYFYILRSFFADPLKHPAEYTSEHVLEFIHRLTPAGTPPKETTRRNNYAALSSFYGFAARYKIKRGKKKVPLIQLADIPTLGMSPPEVKVTPKYWTPEQLSRLFAAIPRDTELGLRDRALFLTYFWTARRRREICQLRWGDIEPNYLFQDGHVGIRYRWTGKGHRGETLSAELPGQAWKAILEYLEFSGRLSTIKPEDPLFVGARGIKRNSPLYLTHVSHRIRVLAQKVGLSGSTHRFRHSAARLRRQEGADSMEVMKLLGHKSLDMTERYLRTMDDLGDDRARKLEEKYQF